MIMTREKKLITDDGKREPLTINSFRKAIKWISVRAKWERSNKKEFYLKEGVCISG